jgi:hypothetical protein
MRDALAILGLPSQFDPAFQREIDRLGAIEPHIEPRMITPGVGDDKLALVVDEHIGADTVLFELGGRDGARFVPEELVAVPGVGGEPVYT